MKNRKNSKGGNVSQTRPFEGKIRQLRRESLILCTFAEVKPFIEECYTRGIKVDVGDILMENDLPKGIIVFRK